MREQYDESNKEGVFPNILDYLAIFASIPFEAYDCLSRCYKKVIDFSQEVGKRFNKRSKGLEDGL
jgi:hypothetical protein